MAIVCGKRGQGMDRSTKGFQREECRPRGVRYEGSSSNGVRRRDEWKEREIWGG